MSLCSSVVIKLLLQYFVQVKLLQAGLDITTCSVPIRMVTISRMSLYRELIYIPIYNFCSKIPVVITRCRYIAVSLYRDSLVKKY